MYFLVKWTLILIILSGCNRKEETDVSCAPVVIQGNIDYTLWTIDKEGNGKQIYRDTKPIGISFHSGNNRLLYGITRNGKNLICELNLETGEQKGFLKIDGPITNFVASSDGKKIALVSKKGIWVIERESNKLKKIVSLSTPNPFSFPYSLSFSPGDDKIAFLWGKRSPFNANLWVVDYKTKKLQQLTFENNLFFQDNPFPLSWSKEGDKILIFQFLNEKIGKGIIVSIDINKKTRKQYIFEGIDIDYFRPVFFPDGNEILFVGHRRGETPNLWQIELKNEKLKQLTRFKEANVCGEISFSPDGKRISFVIFDRNYSIWSVNRDGKELKRITKVSTNYKEDYRYPVWLSNEKLGFLGIRFLSQ